MRKAVLVLILCIALPASINAEQSSWSNLNRLKPGQGIIVIESGTKHHAGKFVSVTDESLTLNEKGSEVSVKRQDVARVSTSSNPRRGEHAVIGLIVGGLIGAGIGATSKADFLGSRGIGTLVGIVIGAPIGAIVGALIPAHRTVYRATSDH
ncbi:MAG: hypothetical protein ACHP8A_08655 [Terriglobales bacterium]